jgi:hypothetical protein
VKIAGHALLDGAAHHVKCTSERVADFRDRAGLVAGFSFESEDAEAFVLRFGVLDG